MTPAEFDRFMSKVHKDESGCWLWTASKSNGYGSFSIKVDGRPSMRRSHRVLYEHVNGPIPGNLPLDHLCRVRACVKPDHLEPVTQEENCYRSPIWSGSVTHCPKGHPFSGDNLLVTNSGHRRCRTCRLLQQKDCRDHLNSIRGKKKKTNKLGYEGVSPAKCASRPFQARFSLNGKSVHLGLFRTAEEAHAAYKQATTTMRQPYAHILAAAEE